MKTKAIKLYEEEGTKYQFDSEKFKVLINQKKLSMIALTMEAKEYLDQRLEALGKEYGWTNYNSEV